MNFDLEVLTSSKQTSTVDSLLRNITNYTDSSPKLIPHDPIEISSNNDFITYGFPGNGTASDPYRIENLEIKAYVEYGIWIRGVSKYFTIQNCEIDVNYGCISISYISSTFVKIRNNFCNGSSYGISIGGVDEYLIENNTCSYNSVHGISITGCSEITVNNNTCFYNSVGTDIHSSENCDFTYNLIFNNRIGFSFSRAKSFVISNNRFYNDGIVFPMLVYDNEYDFKYHTIENNLINDLPLGFFDYLTNQSISQDYGQLVLYKCTNCVIELLSISYINAGVTLIACSNLEIKNTTLSSNVYGLILIDSDYCKIHNNLFKDNSYYGLDITGGSNNKIFLIYFDNNSYSYSYWSEATDKGDKNDWFDRKNKQGNFWSDLRSNYCYYRIDGNADSIDYYPLNRADNCPDFFIQRKLKISLPIVIILPIILSIIYFIYLPFRRKRFDKLNQAKNLFLCSDCKNSLDIIKDSCPNCNKVMTEENVEIKSILTSYETYNSICVKRKRKFVISILSVLITSAAFGPPTFLVCPLIFGPLWILGSGISMIVSLVFLSKWYYSCDDRYQTLKSYLE